MVCVSVEGVCCAGCVEMESSEKAQRIQQDFSKKLTDMQAELKKVQVAKKEHAKLMRNQAQYEKQLKTLQKDLGDMKKHKVCSAQLLNLALLFTRLCKHDVTA